MRRARRRIAPYSSSPNRPVGRQPGFQLDERSLPAVTAFAAWSSGMPLAIVLAAAWIDTLSVEEIAGEIEKSLDILETELRDVPDRQRSVRAVIEWSWKQIDASAQDLLKRLSVYRGGFTRAAAQEAAGASLRELSHLVDRALLAARPGHRAVLDPRAAAPVCRGTTGAFCRHGAIRPRGPRAILCAIL